MNVTSLSSLRQRGDVPASVFHKALELAATGASVSSIAEILDVPRTTLRDKLSAHENCPLPGVLKNAFVSPEGEAFLKRFAIVLHVEVRNMCACGLRVIENILRSTGLSVLLGASLGCQWSYGRDVDEGIVAFGDVQRERMLSLLKDKEITLACDENFHEGPCLIAMEPASNFIVVEELCSSRSVDEWKKAMEPVLAHLGVKVTQVTSDSGTSILALAESVLSAHHSPDLFHILYDFKRSFAPAMRIVKRSIERDLSQCERELASLDRMQSRWDALLPQERGRGRAPNFEKRKQEQENLFITHTDSMVQFQRCEKRVNDALKSLSQSYHPVCLTTGKRTGKSTFDLILQKVLEDIRYVINELSLAPFAQEALEKFERMTAKMSSTLENIELRWRSRARAAFADRKTSFVLESLLAPAAYLERLAQKTNDLKAHALKSVAKDLRCKAHVSLSKHECAALEPLAVTMANDFQRSSSMVEGRNGQLSLRHHAFHELPPLKRQVLTIMHNYVQQREDGTTASERFSGVKPDELIEWLCCRIKSFPKAGGRRSLAKAS